MGERTNRIAHDLYSRVHDHHESLSPLNKWSREIITWCLSNKDLKSRILRFVDVLPALTSDRAVAEHIRDYFPSSESRLPLALRGGSLISRSPLTSRAVARLTRTITQEIAQQFICGETIEQAKARLNHLKGQGYDISLDVLGEAVLSEAEADRHLETYQSLIDQFPPKTNVSVKCSALTPNFDPIHPKETIEQILRRLVPLVEQAKTKESFINIDMEDYSVRDLTLEIVKRLVQNKRIKGYPNIGTVIQAYLKDASAVSAELIAWLRDHRQPMTLRLVKGAYWDSEVAKAKAAEWPVPVWTEKDHTDYQFERLTETLLPERDLIRVAIASHNIRSVANALAVHQESTFAADTIEFQLLYGMADPLKRALLDLGQSVRVYSPFGPLIPGMAYLVRRLLENSSNESFLTLDMTHRTDSETLLRPPVFSSTEPKPEPPSKTGFQNEPPADFSKSETRDGFSDALQSVREKLGSDYPLLIDGKRVLPRDWIASLNPAHPSQIIGKFAKAEWKNVESAIQLAQDAQAAWDQTPIPERSAVLVRAAGLIRKRRFEFAAWEVLETGKTWREADADVAEAIDFLNYYAETMIALDSNPIYRQAPGETNRPVFHGRGLAAIIAPWNFPLAILTGMTSAALAAGNAVLLKPAEPSSVIAYHFADVLLEAGVPPGAVAYLPGPGSEIGSGMVRHPLVDIIAFTGSREVGLSILRDAGHTVAGQINVKKVIAEMGGKNAIIVDEDADLDEALKGVLASAFGYQGQKCSACSRVILHHSITDLFLDRLKSAMARLVVGDPANPCTDVGPVIDYPSRQKILSIIEEGKREARLAFQGKNEAPHGGYFIPPTLFTDAPVDGTLSRQEIFGPVLTAFRVHSFPEALQLANNSSYALTAGVYSRNLANIRRAESDLMAGNLYINRKITGAFVSRQPFGGFRLSGTGTKAGGPFYLHNFLFEKTVTENTLRHGFPV